MGFTQYFTRCLVCRQRKVWYLNFCDIASSNYKIKNNFLTIFLNTTIPGCTFLHSYFQIHILSPPKFWTLWCVSQRDPANNEIPTFEKAKIHVTRYFFLQNTPLIFVISASFLCHCSGLIFHVNGGYSPILFLNCFSLLFYQDQRANIIASDQTWTDFVSLIFPINYLTINEICLICFWWGYQLLYPPVWSFWSCYHLSL